MRLTKWARRAGKRMARSVGSWPSSLVIGLGIVASRFLPEHRDAETAPSSDTPDDGLTLDVSAAVGAPLPDPLGEVDGEQERVVILDPVPEPSAISRVAEFLQDSSSSKYDLELEGFELDDDLAASLIPAPGDSLVVGDYQVYTLGYVQPQQEMFAAEEEEEDDGGCMGWEAAGMLLAGGLALFAGGNSSSSFDIVEDEEENTAPVSTDDRVETDEDIPVILSLSDFGAYADADGDALAAIQLASLPAAGELEYFNGEEWVGVTLDQVVAAADIEAGHLRFTPEADANGEGYASIGFRVYDGESFSDGEYQLTIDVAAVNDPAEITFDVAAGLFSDDGSVIVDAYGADGSLLFTIGKVGDGYEIIDGIADARFPEEGGVVVAEKIVSGTTINALVEFNVKLYDYFGDVIFNVREGATYVDEATYAGSGEFSTLDIPLRAAVNVPENSSRELSITPFTEMAVQLIEKALDVSVGEASFLDIATNYAAAATAVNNLVGVDIVNTRVITVDDEERYYSDGGEEEEFDDSTQYGLKLAALSELAASDSAGDDKVGISSIIDELEVTLEYETDDDGTVDDASRTITYDSLLKFTSTQVALTDNMEAIAATKEIISETDGEVTVSEDVVVRDAVKPKVATIDDGNPESAAFFISGSVDLIDKLNSAGTEDYLTFTLIFENYTVDGEGLDNQAFLAEYDPEAGAYVTSDPSFSITSFDGATGQAEWSFVAEDVVMPADYAVLAVVTDPAENASALLKEFTVTDAPPEVVIDIDRALVLDDGTELVLSGETVEVRFDFSEEIYGFIEDDIELERGEIVEGSLEQDPDDPTLWRAQLTVTSDETLFPLELSIPAEVVTDWFENGNLAASHDYGVYVGGGVELSESIIDDFLHSNDELRYVVPDGYDPANLLLRGSDGNDLIDGYTGDDILYGMGGNDILSGGEHDDVLLGGDGDDLLLGGDGDDVVNGGAGDDRYYADLLGDYLDTENFVVGGEGYDTVVFKEQLADYSLSFVSQDEVDHFNLLLDEESGFRGITEYELAYSPAMPVLKVERTEVIENVFRDPAIDYDHQVDYVQVEQLVFDDITLLFSHGEKDSLEGTAGNDLLVAMSAVPDAEAVEIGLSGGAGADTFAVVPLDPDQTMLVTIHGFSVEEDVIDIAGLYASVSSGSGIDPLDASDYADLVEIDASGDFAMITLDGLFNDGGEAIESAAIRIEFNEPVASDASSEAWFAAEHHDALAEAWWDNLFGSLES